MPETTNFPYLPHTENERQEMLKAIGVRAFDELIKHIPASLRAKELNLPEGLNELELREHVAALAMKNKPTSVQSSFLGGGAYRRFVPAAVSALVSRSEFATAYTPYQPEVSQGSLQVIYEFQTAVCLLTGMDVANASMYDGPTACAEAALMAARLTGRNNIVLTETLNPEYRKVTQTYVQSCGLTIVSSAAEGGVVEPKKLNIDSNTAAVIVQHPNYLGCLEELEQLALRAHQDNALLIVVADPISLALLKPPGECGADIVVGDAQPCGNNLSFGGPSAGFMSTKKEFVRQLPGRLAGMTVDNRGQRAFTLTLQTREQHIRRAKATSNICTNQALNALTMLVYLTLLGPQGLRQLAEISVRRAHHLASLLCQIDGVRLMFEQPFFNEFVIETDSPSAEILDHLRSKEILGGLDLKDYDPACSNALLVAVTEMNRPAELERYAAALSELLRGNSTKSPVAVTKRRVNA
jgi:glycine dehydrogenase subunit 1